MPAPDPFLLQGYWEGKGEEDESTMTIDGDSLYFYRDPDFQYDTTFTLVEGSDPPQLLATILDGPRSTDSAGDVVYVVYKFEDDTLTMAVFDERSDGPPGFDAGISLNEFVKGQPRE